MSASSIFWLLVCKSSLCQSGLQESCYGTCLSALDRWLLEHMESLGNRAPARCLSSSLGVLLTSNSWLLYHYYEAQRASFSCLKCWQFRDFCQLACFKVYPKTSTTAVGWLLSRWWLSVREKNRFYLRLSTPRRSTPRPVLTKIVVVSGFLYSQLVGSFLLQHSTWDIKTRH